MSAAAFTPASVPSSAGAAGTHGAPHPHRVGGALRAAKVLVSAAFGVVVLGDYASEAGVRRR
ncbi:hypothetical protein CP970_24110 [Streptomyces kanamyceticus]|uniref:Uncharacterized protein n=1 Tax=Streptomyces kanamyceticus TaxID=1967 RepID=A0A5J6GHR6_STRKN|nr:hypothetical protein [Streptomyces kanamyceticus]QEU93581.1 hypothetical protein CP970_24110 [Streptomyces kanamyceticus]